MAAKKKEVTATQEFMMSKKTGLMYHIERVGKDIYVIPVNANTGPVAHDQLQLVKHGEKVANLDDFKTVG